MEKETVAASCLSTEKQSGRIEERKISVSSELNACPDWPHLQQVFRLERRFTHLATGEIGTDVVYGVTDLSAETTSPKRLLSLVRME